MIEMLGVLAIIGVLSVGGIAGYSKAMLKYKTNKTIDSLTMLVTNIRTLYAQQDTFTGLNVTNAISMGVVPDELYDTGATTLTNPFSGSVTINTTSSVPGAAGADRAFVIGVNGIPKEACMAMATSDWGSNYSSGLIGMAVTNKGGLQKDNTAATGEPSNAVDAAVAASLLMSGNTAVSAATKGDGIFAGADCKTLAIAGTGTAVTGAAAGTTEYFGAYCAKDLPINVADAARGCDCDGSNCSFAIKYY